MLQYTNPTPSFTLSRLQVIYTLSSSILSSSFYMHSIRVSAIVTFKYVTVVYISRWITFPQNNHSVDLAITWFSKALLYVIACSACACSCKWSTTWQLRWDSYKIQLHMSIRLVTLQSLYLETHYHLHHLKSITWQYRRGRGNWSILDFCMVIISYHPRDIVSLLYYLPNIPVCAGLFHNIRISPALLCWDTYVVSYLAFSKKCQKISKQCCTV